MSPEHAAGASLPILQGPAKHKDPVCGMTVAPEKAAGKVEHAANTYYFCSKQCAERFSREPDRFLAVPGSAGMDHDPTPGEHGTIKGTPSFAPAPASCDHKVHSI